MMLDFSTTCFNPDFSNFEMTVKQCFMAALFVATASEYRGPISISE